MGDREQEKIEKVINGLWCCIHSGNCNKCGYDGTGNNTASCLVNVLKDALALLKAQEPHLLTLDEIHDSMVVYLEAGTEFLKRMDDDGVVLAIGGSERAGAKCFITVWDVGIAAMDDEYNVTWRAWSERPTVEQRERTPWRTLSTPAKG